MVVPAHIDDQIPVALLCVCLGQDDVGVVHGCDEFVTSLETISIKAARRAASAAATNTRSRPAREDMAAAPLMQPAVPQ